MYDVKVITIATNLVRKVAAAVAIGAVAVAFVAAGHARADSKQGTGTTRGCQVENDGKVETVPVGTKVGLFTCGSDGEWHFGWLVNAITAPSHKTIKAPIPGAVRHGVLQRSSAGR